MLRMLQSVHVIGGIINNTVLRQLHDRYFLAVYLQQERTVIIAPVRRINTAAIQPQLLMKIMQDTIRHTHTYGTFASKAAEDSINLIHQCIFFFISILYFMQITVIADFMSLRCNVLNDFRMNLRSIGSSEKGCLKAFFLQHLQDARQALLRGIKTTGHVHQMTFIDIVACKPQSFRIDIKGKQ